MKTAMRAPLVFWKSFRLFPEQEIYLLLCRLVVQGCTPLHVSACEWAVSVFETMDPEVSAACGTPRAAVGMFDGPELAEGMYEV